MEKYVQEYQYCQRCNQQQPKGRAPSGTISANAPFQKLAWDIIGPLPTTSRGCKYLLVVADVFTKYMGKAFLLRSADAESLAMVLVNKVVWQLVVSEGLHSD